MVMQKIQGVHIKLAMKWWLMSHVRLRGVYATTQGVMPLPGHRANHWVVCNAWVQKY